ncbi:hypothetical protein B0T21DRAFT_432672 [Apiosordaria backusii]|uniref:NACHT domain-containing protein n=1 Tax=Apiosordaria backusii TaxID=314023 RepID=A0AA40ELQ8_9PEZI|nr:hypothetical protein B0T21DRAFT_432672 [Apiosordaria backusii]
MDPVSSAASIIAIIQIADKIIRACKAYIEAARDAPSDLRLILVEFSTLRSVLENLKCFISHSNNGFSALDSLSSPQGPIKGCQLAMTELERLLPPHSMTKVVLSALAWPLKEGKAKKLLEEIKQHKTTIVLALTADTTQVCNQQTNSALADDGLATMLRKSSAKSISSQAIQRHTVYSWLRKTDPFPLHHRACDLYEPGTGDWVFRWPEWIAWVSGSVRFLWIYGIPGAGKTVLLSHLADTLEQDLAQMQTAGVNIACMYYYCYFGHHQDESGPFLRWILERLCRALDGVPLGLYKIFEAGVQPSVTALLPCLEELTKAFERIFIFVDAVDESSPRVGLLKLLRHLATNTNLDKIHVLATSREYMDIKLELGNISAAISMTNPLVAEDIQAFVQTQIQEYPKIKRWPDKIKADVLEALTAKAGECECSASPLTNYLTHLPLTPHAGREE